MNELQRLARLHGVALSFEDGFRVRRRVSNDVLEGVLRGLDVDATDPASALRDGLGARWSELCGPVAVAWDGRLDLLVRATETARSPLRVDLRLEDGDAIEDRIPLGDLPIVERYEQGRTALVSRRARLPRRLPAGYHHATVRLGARSSEVLVISAPLHAPVQAPETRAFGVIAPLYSLRSKHGHGIADLGDLRRLLDWVRDHDGDFVGTLPLLAAFLDAPAEISPYRPASRLAWNELYLELPATPEWPTASGAASFPDPAAPREAKRLGRAALADPAAAYALKRPAIEALARTLFAGTGERRHLLARFEAERPEIVEYARFRAATEALGRPWSGWPARARAGRLREAAVPREAYQTHVYAQFAMHEQLKTLANHAVGVGPGLYVDLPLGAHPDGFDTWRDRETFARALGVGAPPDRLFEGGQSWGFPPLHPDRARRLGYRHLIEVVRNHLRYAGVLRIDHVMGVHRLYVIPPGGSARDGTYLRFAPDEVWAILVLEATRAGAVLVGEDLGTVPRAVRTAMGRHGVGGMHVLEFAARPGATPSVVAPPPDALASLSTHDLPPLAGWSAGDDIRARRSFGFSDAATEATALARRELDVATLKKHLELAPNAGPDKLLEASLRHLGASEAPLVAVSLDELAGAHASQNVPGTSDEHPNWRRRTERSRTALSAPATLKALSTLTDARRVASSKGD